MLDDALSKTKLKGKLQNLAASHLAGKISPNQLSLFGFGLALIGSVFIWLSGILIAWEWWFIGIAVTCMLLSFFLDTLDGALARVTAPTTYGGILDIFLDRAGEIVLLLAIVSTAPAILLWPGFLSMATIVLCITIFLLVGGAVKEQDLVESEKILYYSRGIMERGETELFLLLMVILRDFRMWILWIFAILVLVTAIQRFYIARKLFRAPEDVHEGS